MSIYETIFSADIFRPMSRHEHAVEKLTNVLECLATHPGDACERIASAYSLCSHLLAAELPEDCRKDWESILSEITKLGPSYDGIGRVMRGSAENTMMNVRKATAAKIAKKFYALYWRVCKK